MKRSDLTGQRFGRLVAIRYVYSKGKNKMAYWEFQCDCGNKKIATRMHVVNGNTASCGCLRKEMASKRILDVLGQTEKMPNGEPGKRNLYTRYRVGAEKRGLPFEITLDDFGKITKQNCFYCGKPPYKNTNNMIKHNGEYIYNGIDRLDSCSGYVLGNIVACCTECNYSKRTQSLEQFKKWVIDVYNNWASH